MSAAPAEQPRVSKGLLIALGAAVGLAALAALWFFVAAPLLFDDAPVVVPVAEGEEPGTEPEEVPEAEAEPPPETNEFFTARDPFQQLVQPAVAAPAATGDSDSDDDSGGDDDQPAPAVRVGETTVRLVDVVTGADGVTRVHVEVNGTTHEAAENDQFAERFRVLDISGECATFLFGDNRFTLCKGESIRK